jgi:DNA-binding NarL/FixJ family response regulator
MKPMLRVLLVDDQELIVQAFSILLKREGIALGVQVVGTAENAKESLLQVQKLKPDLVLMDIHMPDMNGNEAVVTIKRKEPNTKILMLSGFDSLQNVRGSKAAGADGYAHKSDSIKSLVADIGKVMSGKYTFVSHYDDALLSATPSLTLTRRQGQVLKLLMQGEHNKSIADTLNISSRTVEKHRAFLMAKLNHPSPIQLSVVVHEMNLADYLL